MKKTLSVTLAALALTACANNARVESTGGDVAVSSTPVNAYSLPAGSQVVATLDQAIGTKVSRSGDSFWATVENPVVAQNGQTVVPAGARIHGTVTAIQGASNPTEHAVIKLDFDRLEMNGRSYPYEARITATNLETRRASDDTRNETIKKAGIGAAAGAVLGAVLSGGELSKILIGGALGAAAGTAISMGVGSTEAVLPQGSQITMQTTQNVAIR